MTSLLKKLQDKTATIGIMGLGHTGLSLADEFAKAGFCVIGYDIDPQKIQLLREGKSYLPFLSVDTLFKLEKEGKFVASDTLDAMKEADAIIVSVPTPIGKKGKPNLTCLTRAMKSLSSILHNNQLVVMQSTSYPGTTEEVVMPLLEASGLRVGQDFFLAHVPEREEPGNPERVLHDIPRLVGGITPKCTELAQALYNPITLSMYPCSSPRVAEAAKNYENAFRLINIAFVNEMKIAFDQMDIDIWEVIDAASTKPFGFWPFYPGPGIGGECIPVDPLYLTWRGKRDHATMSMIEDAATLNKKTADHVIETLNRGLQAHKKKIKKASILILGVSYKKDLSDLRESPALRIMDQLMKKGVHIDYHDFYTPHLQQFNLDSISLNPELLSKYDAVMITTDHTNYDWEMICQNAKLIIDTRHATWSLSPEKRKQVLY